MFVMFSIICLMFPATLMKFSDRQAIMSAIRLVLFALFAIV